MASEKSQREKGEREVQSFITYFGSDSPSLLPHSHTHTYTYTQIHEGCFYYMAGYFADMYIFMTAYVHLARS